MNFLRIENLSLNLGEFDLNNIEINLPHGKVMVILGPSGSGKSVLLETIAGFNHPRAGRIYLDNTDITSLPPEDRMIGFMFQNYALFPHMTVRQNILFSNRFKHRIESEKSFDLDEIISMLQIKKLINRYPGTLSGGEKQRVALARALMRKPKLFLFDEPMSALDARTREELREVLGELLQKLQLTSIYVTHDQEEASALADILGIMNEGRLIQTGSSEDIFNHPSTPFSARFVGMENLFKGKVIEIEKGNERIRNFKIGFDSFEPLTVTGNYNVNIGDEVLVGIRPENILIESITGGGNFIASIPPSNILESAIKTIIPKGVVYKLHLTGRIPLTAFLTHQQLNSNSFSRGNTVLVCLPPSSLHLITH